MRGRTISEPPARRRDRGTRAPALGGWRAIAVFLGLSMVAHGLTFAALSTVAIGSSTSESSRLRSHLDRLDFSLADLPMPTVAGHDQRAAASATIPPPPGGRPTPQNVDAERPGGAGDGLGATEAVQLVVRHTDIRLQDSPWNAPELAQQQRIQTSERRRSREDRRATPSPSDDPFLASGHGDLRDRRPEANQTMTVGAPGSAAPRIPARGRSRSAAVDRVGDAPRQAAPIAHGRPAIDRSAAATTTETRGRPSDDVDSEQLASALVQSWVDASPRAGQTPGDGPGGVRASIPDGAGSGRASGHGGRASPHRPGPGRAGVLDLDNPRHRSWFLGLRRRARAAMRFPRERQLAMDQGVTVYRFYLDARGELVGRPRLTRTSGFPDLDRAALEAIMAALPCDPPPSELMGSGDRLGVRLSLNFRNPMVR